MRKLILLWWSIREGETTILGLMALSRKWELMMKKFSVYLLEHLVQLSSPSYFKIITFSAILGK